MQGSVAGARPSSTACGALCRIPLATAYRLEVAGADGFPESMRAVFSVFGVPFADAELVLARVLGARRPDVPVVPLDQVGVPPTSTYVKVRSPGR